MKELQQIAYLKNPHWIGGKGTIELYEADHFPHPHDLIRGTRVIVFDEEGRILLVHLKDGDRLSFPGGGREAGETPEATSIREVMEEALVEIDTPRLATFYKIDFTDPFENLPAHARQYPYPVGYELHMVARAKTILPFTETNETSARHWTPYEEVRRMEVGLYEYFPWILERAFRQINP